MESRRVPQPCPWLALLRALTSSVSRIVAPTPILQPWEAPLPSYHPLPGARAVRGAGRQEHAPRGAHGGWREGALRRGDIEDHVLSVSKRKLPLIAAACKRLHLASVTPLLADATDAAALRALILAAHAAELRPPADEMGDEMGDEIEMGSPSDEIGAAVDQDGLVDCVVLDAPCSGFGTLRRNPEHRGEADGDGLPTLHGGPCQKPRPLWPARAAQPADWPRLAGALGSLRHALALRGAYGAPAGRRAEPACLQHLGTGCRTDCSMRPPPASAWGAPSPTRSARRCSESATPGSMPSSHATPAILSRPSRRLSCSRAPSL
eukprot:scaffold28869_cov66-Phaeocystis_antarctica.AAC.3